MVTYGVRRVRAKHPGGNLRRAPFRVRRPVPAQYLVRDLPRGVSRGMFLVRRHGPGRRQLMAVRRRR